MSPKKKIVITIDGKRCEGEEGQTILQIARANGINIPTLCYLEGLTPWGGCRLCVVEVAGNQKLVTSCATPATDGMVITAFSERLTLLRKRILELLFSEGNHICPICPYNKGDCTLQQRGYEHGITGVSYSYLYPARPVDLTGKYFGLDHNRCILCGRCVRTCDEIEGVHALDFGNRGIRNQIVVDLGKTFGESVSCTNCGACVANCPTGALFDKAAAFQAPLVSCQKVVTICPECPLGCGLVVYTRDNRIVNVFGNKESRINGGHLCVKGRYWTWAEPRNRIKQPLVKLNGSFEVVGWEKAFEILRDLYKAVPRERRILLISPRLSNEFGAALREITSEFKVVGVIGARNEGGLVGTAELQPDAISFLEQADAIVIVGAQPVRDNGVLAAKIRVAVRHRGAKLLLFNCRRSDLDQWANISAPLVSVDRAFWKNVAKTISGVKRVVIIYGPEAITPIGLTVFEKLSEVVESSLKRGEWVKSIPLPRSTNILGLASHGYPVVDDLTAFIEGVSPDLVHLVVSDEPHGGVQWLEERGLVDLLKKVGAIIVQGAYESTLTELARVVLPTPIWAERSGTYTSFEGKHLKAERVLPLPSGVKLEEEVLKAIFQKT